VNSLSIMYAGDLARQQTARNAEAARRYTQRHAPEEPRPTPLRRRTWRMRWHHPARARVAG
jgi:hypothetical protein